MVSARAGGRQPRQQGALLILQQQQQQQQQLGGQRSGGGASGTPGRTRGGADGDGLLEVRLARLGDPRDHGREALDVVLLGLERLLRDKHREVAALDPDRLDLLVEELLDLLPDAKRPRLEDVAPRDVVVVDHV